MGSSKNSDLIAQAQEWIEHDPDLETRSELLELIKANNTEELDDRFSRRLTFGTAGIRGIQGGGPNRMNRLTLRKAVSYTHLRAHETREDRGWRVVG